MGRLDAPDFINGRIHDHLLKTKIIIIRDSSNMVLLLSRYDPATLSFTLVATSPFLSRIVMGYQNTHKRYWGVFFFLYL